MSETPPSLPFSKSRRAAGLVFLSGEMPFGPDGKVPDGISAQTDTVLRRIAATLEGEGLGLGDVVSVLVHLTDPRDFPAFNEAYARHFTTPLPVRTTVRADLMADARIEITVVAAERS